MTKKFIFLIILISIVSVIVLYFAISKHNNDELIVYVPMYSYSENIEIIDPSNIDWIYDYFLFENLASTLIKDDLGAALGLKPVLCKSWRKINKNTFEFTMRGNLKWSDGTELTLDQVANHLLKLSAKVVRHVRYLKFLQDVIVDKNKNTITLKFSEDVDEHVLHELSLADSGILHPNNPKNGWSVTSGAYYVSSYAPKEGTIKLKANRYFPLWHKDMPQTVIFKNQDKLENLSELFKTISVDFIIRPRGITKSTFFEMRKNAPQVFSGESISIQSLAFNKNHPLSTDKTARKELQYFIYKVFDELKIDDVFLSKTNQIFPVGYLGHLGENYKALEMNILKLKGQKVVLSFNTMFEEIPNFLDVINKLADVWNLNVEIIFSNAPYNVTNDVLAYSVGFLASQRDPMVYLNFFFSGKDAMLEEFSSIFDKDLDQIIKVNNASQRIELIQQVHKKMLDEVVMIPLVSEKPEFYASNRVRLWNINPFEMRMLLYELRWK